MAILSKGSKPENFESRKSLKLCLMNIRGLRSNFVDCESFLESKPPDILALCETNLDGSIGSGKLFVRCYFLLIRNDSITCMHGFADYVKERFPFACDLSIQTLRIFSYVFGFTSLRVLLHFPLLITFFVLMHGP